MIKIINFCILIVTKHQQLLTKMIFDKNNGYNCRKLHLEGNIYVGIIY